MSLVIDPSPMNQPASTGVSVVIPARNAEATIAETLDSLIGQTFQGWEAVVVDDGSTDGTVAEASRFAARDKRIRVVQQQPAGVSAARNFGIGLASNDWLLFLDADDWLLPNHLERLLARIAQTPDVALVYAGCDWVGTGGVRIPRQQAFQNSGLFPLLSRYCVFAIHACLVRRATVLLVGGFDTTLRTCEDWDLWQRIARTNAKFGYVQEVLALYRVRPESASLDGRRGLDDGLEVIARGHRADPRVAVPAAEHAWGEPAGRLAEASLMFVVWAAALELGRGRDPRPLLDKLADMRDPGLEPEHLKWSLFYATLLPSGSTLSDWPQLWPKVNSELRRFLDALEAHSGSRDLAGRALRILSNLILDNVPLRPVTLGSMHAAEIEIETPTQTLTPGQGIDLARIDVVIGQRKFGSLDLPVFDGAVPREVLADAIANDFGWPILAEFFYQSLVPGLLVRQPSGACSLRRGDLVLAEGLDEGEADLGSRIMAQAGWTLFLQELFGEPQWTADKFYSPDAGAHNSAVRMDDAGWVRVEVSGEIPSVQLTGDELHVIPLVAGVALGAFTIKGGPRLLSASALRAAIILECGMELLVASVREGLLGQPLEGSSLRARLTQASTRRAAQLENTTARLGRRELGRIDTILSRRAALPRGAWSELVESARALGEPFEGPALADRCSYAPDFIHRSVGTAAEEPAPIAGRGDARDYGRNHFEALFAEGADPWDYSNEYESRKYEETMSLVPDGVGVALELACAEGHFTERLASRVGKLVAADISRIALERAQLRCASHSNVSFLPIDLVADSLPGTFDLIVCSEVLYYAGDRDDLARVAAKLAAALTPGGRVLLAHANILADEPDQTGFAWALPYGAKLIGDVFASVPGLQLEREIRTPLYRIQLFTNAAKGQVIPNITHLADTGKLTAEVGAHVRVGGGVPPVPPSSDVRTEYLPILAYHRIAALGSEALAQYRLAPDVFEEQLRYLRDAGYRSVGLEEWRAAMIRHAPLVGRCVMFTFDDGTRDFAEFAWPLLQRYGFGATLFVIAGEVGGVNRWDEAYGEQIPLLDWDELRALRAQGLEIGAHSFSHHHLSALAPEEIIRDCVRARRTLLEQLGRPIRSFAYPYGDHDRVVRHLVGAAGFSFGLTCEEGKASLWDNAMQLKRLTILSGDDFASFVRKLGV